MDQTFLLALCVCVGFISGYGVRAMISERRRRQALEAREVRRFFRRQARRAPPRSSARFVRNQIIGKALPGCDPTGQGQDRRTVLVIPKRFALTVRHLAHFLFTVPGLARKGASASSSPAETTICLRAMSGCLAVQSVCNGSRTRFPGRLGYGAAGKT
jgi:hypothetical protein